MKRVYFFGEGKADGNASMREILGGKGANLAEMIKLGIPVPPGFTIATEMCVEYFRNQKKMPEGLREEVLQNLKKIEQVMGSHFGSKENPLLVSVRSGSRVSMPGMMDSILNLGLNDESVQSLAKHSEDERFAYDSYRRLIQMYGDVVLAIPSEKFSEILDLAKKKKGVSLDTDLSAKDLRNLVQEFKGVVLQFGKIPFPQDPFEQLWGAIQAVFNSWNSKRAIEYRRIENIPGAWGTAVNIQAMVFGNMGDQCATGVAFTRNPATGEKKFFGEYLLNAQGEDVVAGIRTPQPINDTSVPNQNPGAVLTLERVMPDVYQQLAGTYQKLEQHFREMQDIEFTIQKGKLWILQTRSGKRTPRAALKIACDLVDEGLIEAKEAILRITPQQIDLLLHPQFDSKDKKRRSLLGKGLAASPGAATGAIYFDADGVTEKAAQGIETLLLRIETSPEDIHGMNVASGILTARGGMTSHAAVVARGMGRPCVVGCNELSIDYQQRLAIFKTPQGEKILKEGEVLSLDGSTGEILLGKVAKISPELTGDFGRIMKWCDEFRRLKVRANADTPEDAKAAKRFGAEGIGLCRTEHMFFAEDRILLIRQMILAENKEERQKALDKIAPLQREDFVDIFREMKDLPVTIRLLDPPLHEFLPHRKTEVADLAKDLGQPKEKILQKIRDLTEANPMLGHRGCRLGITFPEIYETQTRAIMQAAVFLGEKEGLRVHPEIMLPLIATLEELRILRQKMERVCQEVLAQSKLHFSYSIGTMIEIPRAALIADQIAEVADFFSFGTNDLTQMTLGLSRDDSNHFLPKYLSEGIFKEDPFQTLDREGVGQLMRIGVEKGRKKKPGLRCAICGEHGGDPSSIFFCEEIGLDYVSCSPYRVPVARLAAAKAFIQK